MKALSLKVIGGEALCNVLMAWGAASMALALAGCSGEIPSGTEEVQSAIISGDVVSPWTTGPVLARAVLTIDLTSGGATGTLIAPDWVLTVKHAQAQVGNTVTSRRSNSPANWISRTIDRVEDYPAIAPPGTVDVELLHLGTPFTDITPASLFQGTAAQITNQNLTVYGYGDNARGGTCTSNANCTPGFFCDTGTCFANTVDLHTAILMSQPDTTHQGSNPGCIEVVVNNRGQIGAPGDSGGPYFFNNQLAAIHNAGDAATWSIITPISVFRPWMNSILSQTIANPPNHTPTYGPASAMRSAASIDLFTRTEDSGIWYSNGFSLDSGASWQWGQWSQLPGYAAGRPSATAFGSGSTGVAVVIRGTNGMAYVDVAFPPGAFQGFNAIPLGSFNDDLAITYNNGFLYVFGEGGDQRMYWSKNNVSAGYNPNNWTVWAAIPNGWFTSGIAAASASGYAYVTGRGTDNKYYWARSIDGSSWTTWAKITDQTFISAPAITAQAGGRLDVFGIPSNNTLVQSTSTNSGATWSAFQTESNNTMNWSVGASVASSGHIQVFGPFLTDFHIHQFQL